MIDRSVCIEALARMAAEFAGHDPDRHELVKFGEIVAFDGPLWRYPDFLIRAETAYQVLKGSRLVRLKDLEWLDSGQPETAACDDAGMGTFTSGGTKVD